MSSRNALPPRAPVVRLVAAVLAVVLLAGCGITVFGIGDGEPTPAPTRPLGPVGIVPPIATLPAVDDASGLPIVALADLPPEAADTAAVIDAGGPYSNRQDGAVFENREGLLPKRERGYYHEYTVPTPGSDDRGARRIVVGAQGEMYWTADHYDSFAWIDR
jgi:ribonuclease T1